MLRHRFKQHGSDHVAGRLLPRAPPNSAEQAITSRGWALGSDRGDASRPVGPFRTRGADPPASPSLTGGGRGGRSRARPMGPCCGPDNPPRGGRGAKASAGLHHGFIICITGLPDTVRWLTRR